MNIPTTIIGVIGAGILLVLTILKIVTDDRARKDKVKSDLQKEADNAKTNSDITGVFDDINRMQ